MTSVREFCPRCGDPIERSEEPGRRESDDRPGGLCLECYLDEFELIDAPEELQITVCPRCGAVERGNRWVDVGADDYVDVAIEEVTEALSVHVEATDVEWLVDPERVDETTIRMHALFSGVVRGTPIEESVVVPVRIAKMTCDRCGRIAGGYYEGVIQLRATDRTPTADEERRAIEIVESYVADREATGDRNAFVSEISETPDGPDIKISTNQLAQGAASRITTQLGGSVENFPTLVTEDGDGNELYRVTFRVRLPKYTGGDVIDLDDGGGPVLVTSVRGNLKGIRLATGDRYEASYEEGTEPDARKIGTREDAVETTVVTVEDEHAVQVLDPETYEATTIARPDFFDPDAATVEVLKSRSGLYIVPPRGDTEHE